MSHPMQARIMLGLLLVFQLADAATFVLGVTFHGISLEANGFATLAYRWHGLDGVLILKAVAILITLGVLVMGAASLPAALRVGSGGGDRRGAAGTGHQHHVPDPALLNAA